MFQDDIVRGAIDPYGVKVTPLTLKINLLKIFFTTKSTKDAKKENLIKFSIQTASYQCQGISGEQQ
jgi:hypothetical protein